MRVLGIDVPADLFVRWSEWFAPSVQPFLIGTGAEAGRTQPDRPLPAEIRDTFHCYSVPDDLSLIWMTESDFRQLPKQDRVNLLRARRVAQPLLAPSVRSWPAIRARAREQVDGYRFLWWPSLLSGHEEEVLAEYVEDGRRPSRHQEVDETTWQRAADLLPGAQALAGTFAGASGPNCFGAVMAAAGVSGAESVWMQREPFETWLSESTRPGGRDVDVGTVLVWRSPDGLVQHAAVTLGDGWVLHKPSQGWMSPTKVLTVADVKRSAREVGRRLKRFTLEL